MNIVKCLICMTPLFIPLTINAQIAEIAQDVPFIVEGVVISTHPYFDQKKGNVFTDNKILVKNIFKGVFKDSIITVVTEGGVTDKIGDVSAHMIILEANLEAFFFIKPLENGKFDFFRYFYTGKKDNNPNYYYKGKEYTKEKFEAEIIKGTKIPKMTFKQNQERKED